MNILPGLVSRAISGRRETRPLPVPRAAVSRLPQRKSRAGQEPGPYAVTPLQGLTVVTHSVERLVERKVTTEVERQRTEIETSDRNRDRTENRPPTLDVTSDEVVQILLQKMRALAQEERFRLGRLR